MRWEERKVEGLGGKEGGGLREKEGGGVERKGEDTDVLRMLKKVGAREGEVIAADS